MLEKILNALGGYKRSENSIQVKCPAHSDQSPSLTVTLDNEKLLFHCHAGCSQSQVYQSLLDRGLMQTPSTKYSPTSINSYGKK